MSNTFEENKDLINQLNLGCPEAFKAIYEHYFRGLVAFASQYVSFAEAEEVVQESMLWIWENRVVISPNRSLKSLLFTMVKNKALNIIAHQEVKRKAFLEIIKDSEEVATPDDFIHGAIFQKFRKLMNEMPVSYKEAFELNRLKNMTHKEIAEELNVSPQTINYRISQALKLLRIGLKEFTTIALFFFMNK